MVGLLLLPVRLFVLARVLPVRCKRVSIAFSPARHDVVWGTMFMTHISSSSTKTAVRAGDALQVTNL